MKNLFLIAIFGISFMACKNSKPSKATTQTKIEITTTKGNILIALYNETPLHRDNFIKLVNNQFYDSILWHRVIDNFIIQTGDQHSAKAKPKDLLGNGEIGYLVPSEIKDSLFHKRGTLSAAHDGNPDFYSSGSHFVIIQGGPISENSFQRMENRINKTLGVYHTFHADENKAIYTAAKKAHQEKNEALYAQLYDSVQQISSKIAHPKFYHFPEKHKEFYKKYGGAPANDQLYTVFGEVVTGMDVVDAIAASKTDKNDRPIEDIRIISMQIVK